MRKTGTVNAALIARRENLGRGQGRGRIHTILASATSPTTRTNMQGRLEWDKPFLCLRVSLVLLLGCLLNNGCKRGNVCMSLLTEKTGWYKANTSTAISIPASKPASSTACTMLRRPVLSGLNRTSAFPRRRFTETNSTPGICAEQLTLRTLRRGAAAACLCAYAHRKAAARVTHLLQCLFHA